MEELFISENNEEEDINLLEYELDQINQELTWQYQITEINKLKSKKIELLDKIKKLKNNSL